MTKTLVFVYNADAGLFNALTDWVHKLVSPSTYQCSLCALTHSATGERTEWREFVQGLPVPSEFLHRDEFRARRPHVQTDFPAIFLDDGDRPRLLADARSINACRTLAELKELLKTNLYHFENVNCEMENPVR